MLFKYIHNKSNTIYANWNLLLARLKDTAAGYHSILPLLWKRSKLPTETSFIKELILYMKNTRKVIII